MEEFYPSEIARLVLGYLDELKCKKSWQVFIEENSNLSEYLNLYNAGKQYSTKVNGKSLLDILKEYCSLKKEARELVEYRFSELNKDAMDKIIQNAVDHAFQQYFPTICRYDSNNSDDIEIRSNEADKSKRNCKDSHKSINNNSNLSLKASNENDTFPSPQLTDVISLCGFDSSNKKMSILKDSLSNAIKEDEPVCLLETVKIEENIDEPVHLVETVKIEENIDEPMCFQETEVAYDNIQEPNIQNKNILAHKATVNSKGSKSKFNIGKEYATAKKSTLPLSDSLSSIQSNSELILKNSFNGEIQSCNGIEKNDNLLASFNIHNSISVCDDNNIEVKKNSAQFPVSQGDIILNSIVNTQSTVVQGADVNVLSSSSNPSAYTITNDSFSNQSAGSGLSTYILPNFLPNSCFLINTTPNSNNPLVVTGSPINNISNHVFTSVDSGSNGLSYTVPFSKSDNPILPVQTVEENIKSYSNTVAVNEKESAKRKNKKITNKKGKRNKKNAVVKPRKSPKRHEIQNFISCSLYPPASTSV